MVRQYSAGGVVIKKESNGIKVLLIKDAYGRWIWPKGHIEKGESPREAAVREISEETGQKDIEVIGELGTQEYFFTLKGEKIFKTVYIFLIEAFSGEKLAVQTSEIRDARWFGPEQALRKTDYPGSREILEKGINYFREKH